MKIYRLPELAESSPERGYLLAYDDLGTDALYLDYRSLPPKAPEVTLSALPGYELVVYVLKGPVRVKRSRSTFEVGAGEAFCPDGDVLLENPADEEAVILAAGGRAHAKGEPARHESPRALNETTADAPEAQAGAPEPEGPTDEAAEDTDFIITTDDPTEDGLR